MNYSELPSIAVLVADFPSVGLKEGSKTPTPSPGELRCLAESAAASGGGNLVKILGDSAILKFDDPTGAVKAALSLLSPPTSPAKPVVAGQGNDQVKFKPRIGLHIGQARILDGEILGKAVDGASVLKTFASPGTIIASEAIVSATLGSKLFSASALPASEHASLLEGLTGYLIAPLDTVRDAAGKTDKPKPAGPSIPRTSGVGGQNGLLKEIRSAILEDTKTAGRRLSIDEAREKYSWYGAEAIEVIASLAEAGILLKRSAQREDIASESPTQASRRSNSSLHSSEIGKNIEIAVHSIISEIERSVKASSEHRGTDFDRHEFRQAIERGKTAWKEERRADRKARRHGGEAASAVSAFEKYRSELKTKARKSWAGVLPSILSFGLINAGLWYLSSLQPQSFPWVAIVTIFWGAGVLDSILGAIRTGRHSAEAEAFPDLDPQTTTELKLLNKERDSVGKHFTNAISIPAALFLLTPVLWAGQSWPLILSAILAGSFVIHFLGYISTMPGKLRKFFGKAGLPSDRKSQTEARKRRESEPKNLGPYTAIYGEAKASAAAIASSLGSSDPGSLVEMKPQLDAYLDQILLLSKTANELDAIIGEIPMVALASDKAELLAKSKSASSVLKSEYVGSIAEIVKQEESFKALTEQREIIDLRLRSSVNQLQQLKIDLVRVRVADRENDARSGESAISSLRTRSQELSQYINDLRSGQLEAALDPFAELERRYGTQPSAGTDPLSTSTP